MLGYLSRQKLWCRDSHSRGNKSEPVMTPPAFHFTLPGRWFCSRRM